MLTKNNIKYIVKAINSSVTEDQLENAKNWVKKMKNRMNELDMLRLQSHIYSRATFIVKNEG